MPYHKRLQVPMDARCIVQNLEHSSIIWWAAGLTELNTNMLCQAAGSKNWPLLLVTPVATLEDQFYFQLSQSEESSWTSSSYSLVNGQEVCPVLLEGIDCSIPRGVRSRSVSIGDISILSTLTTTVCPGL